MEKKSNRKGINFDKTKQIYKITNELLHVYKLDDHFQETKEWYDGYRFGKTDVYCPWDVINYVDRLYSDPEVKPQAYWINTSGNDLVKRFIDKANKTTRDEIERLVSEEAIEKFVRLELTYDEIDKRCKAVVEELK